MAYQCKFCDTTLENVRNLSAHLRIKHQTSLETYYLIDHPKTQCQTCGIQTSFKNYIEGYNKCCISRKCSCLWHRKQLAADPVRNQKFIDKVAENQVRIWAGRSDEECKAIRSKDNYNGSSEWRPWMAAIIALDETPIREAFGI